MGGLRYAGIGTLAVAAVAALAGSGDSVTAAGASGQTRPNVIVLMSDDQTAVSQSVMTHTNELIGAHGATFTNNFTNWPLCCPSRTTFLTGQYAHNHQVLGNSPPFGGFDRLDTRETLPVWLQRAGYYTAHIGKFLNGYENSSVGVPPGWSEWHGTKRTYTFYGEQLLEDGQVVTYGSTGEDPDNPAQPQTYSTDVYTDKAVQLINQRAPAAQPFFLSVAYLGPHSGGPNQPAGQPQGRCEDTAKPAIRHKGAFGSEPLPAPPNFNEADVADKPAGIASRPQLSAAQIATVTRYYRCRLESLLAVDEGVQRVVEALDAQGELDNTLLIYTSDNGFFHGEHRIMTGKNRVYEEAIRVPLEIRGPGVPEGVTVDDLAINADIAPTIVDATGADAARVPDGQSLLPFAAHPERSHGRELLIEQYTGTADEEGQPGVAYVAVRTSRYKYVANGTGEIELYDIAADPYELTNLHGDPAYAAAEAALASRLASLRSCAGKSCRTKPGLELKLPRSVRHGGRSCRKPSDLVAKVRGGGANSVSFVAFRVGAKLSGRDSGTPLEKRLKPRLLRAKRRPEVRAIAELVDGRKLSLQKRVRICR
jgi:N-acetylglucosamine-6-sulfatase